MSMTVVNSNTRLISMLQFFGIFLVAFGLACFGFYQSMSMSTKIPAKEQALMKEKALAIKSFSTLSKNLQKFEDAQNKFEPTATSWQASCQTELSRLHAQIDGKNAADFQDVKLILDMADQYFVSIKKAGQNLQPIQKTMTEMQVKITGLESANSTLEKENSNLQQQNFRLQDQISALRSQIK